jgi:hypothetical protein
MKTLRFGLLALMLSAMAFCYANNDTPERNRSYQKISLREAMGNRGLVYAIRTQVDPCSLLETRITSGFYYAEIRCNETIYRVFAVYKEWVDFFNQGRNVSPALNTNVLQL